jgi:hypothetical protein
LSAASTKTHTRSSREIPLDSQAGLRV